MSDESFDEKITKIHLEKYWEIYRDSESKRIKAFFYLLIFGIVLIIVAGQKNIQVNISDIEFEISNLVIILSAPLIIIILTLRFYYLSALALSSHVKFNQYFEHYRRVITLKPAEIKNINTESEKENCLLEADKRIRNSMINKDDFRENDLSEFPNIFLVPIQIDKSKTLIKMGHPIKRKIFDKSLTFSLKLLTYFPIFVYLILLSVLIMKNWEEFHPTYILVYLFIYALIAFFLVIALQYFKVKTSDKRSYLINKG